MVPPKPRIERLDWMERLLGAPRVASRPEVEALDQPELPIPQLPRQISIQDALGMQMPTLDSLLLGVTLNEAGEIVPIRRALYQLMHLLAIGITGSGKSTWLLSFLSQIAMCPENIEVLLIDVHGSAFNLASKWSKLRYPIARNNGEAKRVLNEVFLETERRAELFQQAPLAEDLASYNREAPKLGLETLDPWLIVIDEGTLMLTNSAISGYVGNAVQGTRQYGLYVFMTGQTGNAKVVNSEIRSNFPTRVCMATERPSMQAALGTIPEGELEDVPGRGWARLKGSSVKAQKFQSPYIRREQFYKMIEHEGPRFQMPEAPPEGQLAWSDDHLRQTYDRLPTKTKTAMVKALWVEQGKDPSKAPNGGHFWGQVDQAGKRAGLWE
jgi:hypothetical protein